MIRPTIKHAKDAAELLVLNSSRYGQEKDYTLNNFKMNSRAISRITGHQGMVPRAYMLEVLEHMPGLGWSLFPIDGETWGFIKLERVDRWMKLASKRVVDDPNWVNAAELQGDAV